MASQTITAAEEVRALRETIEKQQREIQSLKKKTVPFHTTFNWDKAMINLSQAIIEEFTHGDLECDLSLIPGVGPRNTEIFNENGIRNAFNLIGKFLIMFNEELTTQKNCDAFCQWLVDLGVSGAYINSITRLVVEKVYVLMPGMLDLYGFN
jgi:hypothetical protein